ncbi:MAG: ABC transporter permease [Ruminococcus sp.]
MRTLLFGKRNAKEILRDPLSYVFTLGFPVLLLVVFQVIASCTPSGQVYWFELGYLAPGIAVFSFSFVMLYMSILVANDRTTTFLSRLYTSPMKAFDFIAGYNLPGMVICLGQIVICYITVGVISLITGEEVSMGSLWLTIPVYLPLMLMFVSVGVMFGCLFNNKSAPGICSVVIQVVGFLGGIWMPVSTMGGYETVCECLPFYPAVQIGRSILLGEDITDGKIPLYIVIALAYIVVLVALSIICFKVKTQSDDK